MKRLTFNEYEELWSSNKIEQFIIAFMPYVDILATKLYSENKMILNEQDFEDLKSEGYELLIKRARKHECANFNSFFSSFNTQFYERQMLKYRDYRKLLISYFKYIKKYNRYPTYDEYISILGIKSKEIDKMIRKLNLKFSVKESLISYNENSYLLDKMDSLLTPKERKATYLYFGEEATLDEISYESGISRERVRQLKDNGLKKLTKQFKK